jgi:DNA-binding Lrp family transcriptional regulator
METKLVKSRLTLCEREEIIKLHNGSVPVMEIAKQFKVSRPTIYKIIDEVQRDQKKIDFYIEKEDENKDIMEPITKTSFLGVVIDTENGSSNPKINKALGESFHLLDIMKFIEVTKFKLNMTMFDYFWQAVAGNTHSLITMRVFKWFGYEGEYYTQKQSFKKMLKNNGIEYHELTQQDREIEKYPDFKEELQLLPSNVTNAKFIVMDPKNLKRAIMQLKTKNGHIIRDYYIDLEDLLKLYVEYTLYFNHRESQRKITDLEQMMAKMDLEREQDRQIMVRQEQYMRSLGISLEEVKDQTEELLDSNKGLHKQNKKIQRKLGIAVEDRAPQPEDETKRGRFVMLKRNDPEFMGYYTIRAHSI